MLLDFPGKPGKENQRNIGKDIDEKSLPVLLIKAFKEAKKEAETAEVILGVEGFD